MNEIRAFFERIQLKPNIISGHVSSVQINRNTGEQEYALVAVGGNTIRVKLDPFAPVLANGDQIRLEQVGYAASAEYRLTGIEAGGRPASGVKPVLNDGTDIGGVTYNGGDLIIGKLDGGNVFAEYATGNLYHRVGSNVYGVEFANGAHLFGHAIKDGGGNWVGDGNRVVVDPTNGISMFAGITQRVAINTDGSGWFVAPGKISWTTDGTLTVTGVQATKVTVSNGVNSIWLNDSDDGSLEIGGMVKAFAPFQVTAAGAMTATSATITGTINMSAGSIVLGSTNKLWLNDSGDGALNIGGGTKASAPFRVTAAGALTASNANITGTIDANSGYLGTLTVDGTITVGTGGQIKSSGYASDTTGWAINSAGDAEFNNVSVRGAIRTSVLHYGQVLATNGSLWVVPSAGKTTASVTSVDSPTTFYINVEIPDGMTSATAATLWAANDIVRIKDPVIGDLWAKIAASGVTDMTTYTRLTVTKQSPAAGTNYTFTAGVAVLNYKQANAGFIRLTADAANSPYISIATHPGTPWANMTERVRLGNLGNLTNPATGATLADGTYGLWTDNGYFGGTIDANAGHIGSLDIDGILTIAAAGELRQGTGTVGTNFNGLRIYNNSGVGVIAGYNAASTAPQWYAGTDGKLYAGGGAVSLDANGISLGATNSYAWGATLKWFSPDFMGYALDPAYNLGSQLYGVTGGTGGSKLVVEGRGLRYYNPAYGWLVSDAGLLLRAVDPITNAQPTVFIRTKPDDGESTVDVTPGTGKKMRVSGRFYTTDDANITGILYADGGAIVGGDGLTVNGALEVYRSAATYTGKVFIAGGTVGMSSNVTLTPSVQTILTTTQSVPAGTLVVNAMCYYQVSDVGWTGINDVYFDLVVDGVVVATGMADVEQPWSYDGVPVNWVGPVAAGSRTWYIRARKNGAHDSMYATALSKMAWQFYA